MIVLDTNVVSALMLRQPLPAIRVWLDRQVTNSVWTAALSVFEIRLGLARLDPGSRRFSLEASFSKLLDDRLEGRVLDFDAEAATRAAALSAARMRIGRPQDHGDTLIAGIVLARDATLATRNTRHFPDIPTVDPWQAGTASS